jgi:hypothetical protein
MQIRARCSQASEAFAFRVLGLKVVVIALVVSVPPASAQLTGRTNGVQTGVVVKTQTAAELAAGITRVDTRYPELDIRRYGTNTTPGKTDMTPAIRRLAAVLNARRGGTALFQPETYKIWVGSSPDLLYLRNATDVVVDFNGATLQSGRTNGPGVFAVTLNHCQRCEIRNGKLIGSNTTLTAKTGEGFVNILNGSTQTRLANLHAKNCNTLVEIGDGKTPPLTNRISGVAIENLVAEDSYYGLAAPGDGDGVRGNILGINTGRVYFPWNVQNHDVWIQGQQEGPFTDVLLKAYGYMNGFSKLRNIEVHYKSAGKSAASQVNTAPDAMLKLEMQLHDVGAHVEIRNIDVTFDITAPTGNGGAQMNRIFNITKLDENALPDGKGRGHVIDNVRVRGVLRDFQNAGAHTNRLVPIMIFDNSTDGIGHQFNWTGDFARNIVVEDIVIHDTTASPGFAGVFVNGQPFVSGELGLTARNLDLANFQYRRVNWNSRFRYVEQNIAASGYTPSIAYNPSWTAASSNPSLGSGKLTGYYAKRDNEVTVTIELLPGSTTKFGIGTWYFALPSIPVRTQEMHSSGEATLAGRTYAVVANTVPDGTARVQLIADRPMDRVNATVPGSWTNGDRLRFTVRYIE